MKQKTLNNFRNDESGGILAFTLLMFLVMLVGGGMAVDFINYEYRREGVQDALDRGVLAAAGLGNEAQAYSEEQIAAAEAEAIETVNAYIRSGGYDPDAIGLVVTPDFAMNSQLVAAVSDFSVDTFFLRLTGIETLNGGAAAQAEISRNQIELSLVVDISGSMGGTKIVNLREAATNFVTGMLEDDRSDYTTISLVPFSGQVAVNRYLMNQYPNYDRWHNYSSCVNFSDADYGYTTILPTASLTQTQHFERNNNMHWCPEDGSEASDYANSLALIPYSNRVDELTAGISSLVATGMTATYIGMKWGTALLDPTSQPVLTGLTQDCTEPVIVDGEIITASVCRVDPLFDGRPRAYDDDETMKFLILMTDGDNTAQSQIKPDRYRRARRSNGRYYPWQNYRNADIWDTRNPGRDDKETLVSGWAGDPLLQNICEKADDAGIVIFTIGYDVTTGSRAYNQMLGCASDSALFFNVPNSGGTNHLDAAFTSIRQTIQRLKLTN